MYVVKSKLHKVLYCYSRKLFGHCCFYLSFILPASVSWKNFLKILFYFNWHHYISRLVCFNCRIHPYLNTHFFLFCIFLTKKPKLKNFFRKTSVIIYHFYKISYNFSENKEKIFWNIHLSIFSGFLGPSSWCESYSSWKICLHKWQTIPRSSWI